jgi:lipoyl(octanoyl) transferase
MRLVFMVESSGVLQYNNHQCSTGSPVTKRNLGPGGYGMPDKGVEWTVLPGLSPYAETLAAMEDRVAAIRAGTAPEAIWLLEHPPLYTAGTSARGEDLVQPDRFPVHVTGRGGQYTYHGPGQRVVYVMLDVAARGQDVRCFVRALERWVIDALAEFNVRGEIRQGRVGVWVQRPDKPAAPDGSMREDKIAAIGIKLRRWVSFHGLAINVEPDLSHFDGIVPCGIREHGVTSMVDLGLPVTMADLDAALMRRFAPAMASLGKACAVS